MEEIRFVRNPDGTLSFHPCQQTPPEAICPRCDKPIQWCLDMFSFTTGDFGTGRDYPFTLAHARCVWAGHAFRVQEQLTDEE